MAKKKTVTKSKKMETDVSIIKSVKHIDVYSFPSLGSAAKETKKGKMESFFDTSDKIKGFLSKNSSTESEKNDACKAVFVAAKLGAIDKGKIKNIKSDSPAFNTYYEEHSGLYNFAEVLKAGQGSFSDVPDLDKGKEKIVEDFVKAFVTSMEQRNKASTEDTGVKWENRRFDSLSRLVSYNTMCASCSFDGNDVKVSFNEVYDKKTNTAQVKHSKKVLNYLGGYAKAASDSDPAALDKFTKDNVGVRTSILADAASRYGLYARDKPHDNRHLQTLIFTQDEAEITMNTLQEKASLPEQGIARARTDLAKLEDALGKGETVAGTSLRFDKDVKDAFGRYTEKGFADNNLITDGARDSHCHAEMRQVEYYQNLLDRFDKKKESELEKKAQTQIQYLKDNPVYIGLSKLCCAHCYLVLSPKTEGTNLELKATIDKKEITINIEKARGGHSQPFEWLVVDAIKRNDDLMKNVLDEDAHKIYADANESMKEFIVNQVIPNTGKVSDGKKETLNYRKSFGLDERSKASGNQLAATSDSDPEIWKDPGSSKKKSSGVKKNGSLDVEMSITDDSGSVTNPLDSISFADIMASLDKLNKEGKLDKNHKEQLSKFVETLGQGEEKDKEKHVGDAKPSLKSSGINWDQDINNAFNKSGEQNYQYETNDINAIGRQILSESSHNINSFTNALGVGVGQLGAVATLEPKKKLLDEKQIDKVMGVYNTGGNHWVSFMVKKDPSDDEKYNVHVKDSYGNERADLKNQIEGTFGGDKIGKYMEHKGVEQADAVSCGVFALENMNTLANMEQEQLDNFDKQQFLVQKDIAEKRIIFAAKYADASYKQAHDDVTLVKKKHQIVHEHEREKEELKKILKTSGIEVEIRTTPDLTHPGYNYVITCSKSQQAEVENKLQSVSNTSPDKTDTTIAGKSSVVMRLNPDSIINDAKLNDLKQAKEAAKSLPDILNAIYEVSNQKMADELNVALKLDGKSIPPHILDKCSDKTQKVFVGSNKSSSIMDVENALISDHKLSKKDADLIKNGTQESIDGGATEQQNAGEKRKRDKNDTVNVASGKHTKTQAAVDQNIVDSGTSEEQITALKVLVTKLQNKNQQLQQNQKEGDQNINHMEDSHLKHGDKSVLSRNDDDQKYDMKQAIAAQNNKPELLSKLQRESVVTADIDSKVVDAKQGVAKSDVGAVQFMGENHSDHSTNVQSLIKKLDLLSPEQAQKTVIAVERKSYGDNLGVPDTIMLANIIKHNKQHPDNQVIIPEKIVEDSSIYHDALLYEAAKEKGVTLVGLEGKNLKTDKTSPDYNQARETYMADRINQMTSKGYDVIAHVGAAHLEPLQKLTIKDANVNTKSDKDPNKPKTEDALIKSTRTKSSLPINFRQKLASEGIKTLESIKQLASNFTGKTIQTANPATAQKKTSDRGRG